MQTQYSFPQSEFSGRSLISVFDYNIPSFQASSSKHLQEGNSENHCDLILDLFL